MTAGLIEELKKVRDFRTKKGQRHPLWFVLLLVIMGTMSDCLGYGSLGDFVKKTVKQIIDTGNDYVIAVKANQPKL